MASPQKEHGYTPIANEILEALARIDLSGQQFRVLFLILRDTYGWGRKESIVSYSELARRVGIDRRQVIRITQKLLDSLVVKKTPLGGSGKNATTSKNVFIFQKDYNVWGGGKKDTSGKNATTPSGQNDTSPYTGVKAKEKKEDVSPPTPSPKNYPPNSQRTHAPEFMEPIGPGSSISAVPDLVQQFISAPRVQLITRKKRVYVVAEPVRKLLLCYKVMQGNKIDDPKWDRVYFKRFAENAEDLLDVFDGDYKIAVQCLAEIAGNFSDKGLTWTLNTIVNHAGEWRSKHAQPSRP